MEDDLVSEGRSLRDIWHFGNLYKTCLTDGEALAICGLVNEPLPQQFWQVAKNGIANDDMIKLAHKYAMAHVQQHGLGLSLEAAWKYWERPIQPPLPPAEGTPVQLPPRKSSVYIGDTSALFRLIAVASKKLKKPGILFKAEDRTYALIRFGDGSHALSLYEGGREAQRRILGGLYTSGELHLAHQEPLAESVIVALRQFLNDPIGSAVEYGKDSGECAFCGRALTDRRSVQAGYGRKCATNFGLPWGDIQSPHSASNIT